MDSALSNLATSPATLTILPLLEGFAIGLGLIMAIGAQGLFVLRQGLTQQHVLPVCLVCSLSDLLLISGGIVGFALLREIRWLPATMTIGGVFFLLWYGFDRVRAGARLAANVAADPARRRLRPTVAICLAVTWLNPHVYVDTVFLIGGLASRYTDVARFSFGIGACAASIAFFFTLGYGARLLAPLMRQPKALRAAEITMGLVMWALAVNLAGQSLTAFTDAPPQAIESRGN